MKKFIFLVFTIIISVFLLCSVGCGNKNPSTSSSNSSRIFSYSNSDSGIWTSDHSL